jgi:PAS domain S-box-containing protein
MSQKINDFELEIVMNSVLDGFIIIDEKGSIQSFNKAAIEVFGYSLEEVIGKNVKMLMPDPYHSEHDQYLTNYKETGDKKIIGLGREIVAQRKDGSCFPMELSVNEMKLEHGRFFLGTIRDITEKKEAEKSIRSHLEHIETMMNTVLDGLITIDAKGIVHSFNHAAESIFGYTKEQVIGQNVKMLMPDPYQSGHDGYLKHYHATGEKKVIGLGREIKALKRNGTIFPMELGVNEMEVQGKQMFVGTIRDISVRKNAEEEIKSFIQKLQISNQELDQFAYIASHDLKEPLRGLANNAMFLQEDYEDVLDDDGNKRINRMRFLCTKMEQLVDSLLYYSRLGRQELAIEETDLNKVITKIKELTLPEEVHDNVELLIPQPLPHITCDVPRVTELFRNLISNSIKYNRSDVKKIEIGVTQRINPVTDKLEGRVFYVKDNGIGIEPNFFDDIFRIFKRLNEEEEDVKGTGVGLTFVKKIIERHNGSIWLESTMKQGTCFFFTLNMDK